MASGVSEAKGVSGLVPKTGGRRGRHPSEEDETTNDGEDSCAVAVRTQGGTAKTQREEQGDEEDRRPGDTGYTSDERRPR